MATMEAQKIISDIPSIKPTSERKLKFSKWYFQDHLEVSTRPDMFVERTKYFKELRDKINSGNQHTLVFAYPGQGKTVSTKVFFNEWERRDNNVHTIYINCGKLNTEKKIFHAVIQEMAAFYPPVLDLEKENEREAVTAFVRNIPKGQKFFLVLDEIDVPIENDKSVHRGQWLNVFFRAEYERHSDGPEDRVWQVLMITNKIAFEQTLDVNERQHIQHMGIDVYISEDIYNILNKRFQVGVMNGDISPSLFSNPINIFGEIAKITMDSYDSNIRTAFHLLIKATEKALVENTQMTKFHIYAAQKELEIDMYLDDMAKMTKSAQSFFFSTLIYLVNKSKETGFKDLADKGYSQGLYRQFLLSEIYPTYNKFNTVNRIKEQKAVERNSQRYINEGVQMGLYKSTGTTLNKFRQYELTLDPRELLSKIKSKYPYNFDL